MHTLYISTELCQEEFIEIAKLNSNTDFRATWLNNW